MFRSMGLGLVCVAIASGLVVPESPKEVQEFPQKVQEVTQEEPKKNYAYVTMWISGKTAPKFVRDRKMTKNEAKHALKAMAEEEGLDDNTAMAKVESQKRTNLVTRLGGEEKAYQGTLQLAQQLKAVGSKYPLVIYTNDPKILDLQTNETKMAKYTNVVIKPIGEGDWLRPECKTFEGNELHYQKLSVFGMTEYDKLIWLDTDVKVRKNMDFVFDHYDTNNGKTVYGQIDDFKCDEEDPKMATSDFCSAVMLFEPKDYLIQKLTDTAKSFNFCWGDQRIIRKYFRSTDDLKAKKFPHKVVYWGHCHWEKEDSLAVHNQCPECPNPQDDPLAWQEKFDMPGWGWNGLWR